jgi:hypothetical protein
MARLTDKTTATAVTLNSLVHIVNTNDISQSSTGSSYKADLGQVAGAIGGYQYYSAVTISSADILTLSSVPVELLPAPGAGNYYDTKFIIEYTFNTTPYITVGNVIITDGTNTIYNDIFDFASFGTDTIFIVQSMIGPTNTGITSNSGLYLTNQTADPTSGDGDLLVKIWYSIRSVG